MSKKKGDESDERRRKADVKTYVSWGHTSTAGPGQKLTPKGKSPNDS